MPRATIKPGFQRPDFNSLLKRDLPSPLDEYEDTEMNPGDAEMAATLEVSAALQAIIDERLELRDRYRVLRTERYYFVVCFQSEEQKKEFLSKMGWLAWGDWFLNGLEVARSLGIDIPPISLPKPLKGRVPVLLRKRKVIK